MAPSAARRPRHRPGGGGGNRPRLRPRGHGDGHADAADLRLTMRAALSRLTPRQRTMLVLRYFEDKSETEIADLLGVRVGSVRSQIYRSLERLKKTAPELSAVREFR
ncbi:sigma-70 family RNA polymerase sigma factor [Nonomuraea sp. NPDC005692]|uniref:sigma-70 family RNA polymerase sigma factor n=1 Tax=Nonomuraea sp. NPDC005692 TaxID=3157168 RepID=UPI0033D399A5